MFTSRTPSLAAAARRARRARRLMRGSLAVLLLCAMACGREDRVAADGEVVDRDTFVEVYVALRQADARAESPEAFAAARDSVLERHGVTTGQLSTFIDVYGHDMGRMVEVWDEIERRLSEEPRDSVAG